jgi:hypothetical protein
MKSKKESSAKDVPSSRVPLFDKTNLMWMLGGVAIMVLGYILMAGGKSEDPNVFNPDEVYSSMRITVAPILILAGLVVLIYSIFRHPKAD